MEASDPGGEATPVGTLEFQGPASVPIGVPFPVVASVASGPPSATVALTTAGGEIDLRLHFGRGSVSMTAQTAGTLAISPDGWAPERHEIEVTDRPVRTLSGVLSGADLSWDASADVRLAADVEVPAGSTLRVGPGTWVLAGPKADLVVLGGLRCEGEEEAPVLVTRSGQEAWGGVRALAGATVELRHTWLTGGGGDPDHLFGHSSSQPVVYAEDASLVVKGGGVVDNPGKAFGALRSRVTLDGVLVSRCDTGGEFKDSLETFTGCHFLEMPDAEGPVEDDDNDGVYLSGGMTEGGVPLVSTVTDCAFAVGEDDAIDHNGATVQVRRVRIEGFRHEGVAGSNGGRIEVIDSVIRGCEQGIEAGYGSPEVVVDHCLVTGNDVGLRYGDSYDWEVTGTLTVTSSIATLNGQNVKNYVNRLGGPMEGAIVIRCSMVDSPEWDGVGGNLPGRPAWDPDGCLLPGSPGRGAGCDGEDMGPRCGQEG